jgi:hypothetical protein
VHATPVALHSYTPPLPPHRPSFRPSSLPHPRITASPSLSLFLSHTHTKNSSLQIPLPSPKAPIPAASTLPSRPLRTASKTIKDRKTAFYTIRIRISSNLQVASAPLKLHVPAITRWIHNWKGNPRQQPHQPIAPPLHRNCSSKAAPTVLTS